MSTQPDDVKLAAVEGEVKWFDQKKGFGFIVGPTGQDIFVHYTQIEGEGYRVLQDGAKVRYWAEAGNRGWHATKVERIEGDIKVRSVNPATRNPRRAT